MSFMKLVEANRTRNHETQMVRMENKKNRNLVRTFAIFTGLGAGAVFLAANRDKTDKH